MPIPKPTDKEQRSDFIKRCFNEDVMLKEFPDDTQRYAVCKTTWDEKNEAVTTGDVAQANPTRLGTFLRNKPVSASLLQEDDFTNLIDFVINLDFEVWENIENLKFLDKLLSDIEYIGRTSTLNEGVLRAKKVSSQKSAMARKWYQARKGHLAARRRTLKNSISAMADKKKKERLRKQRKKLNKKPIRKYSTKGHTNESRVSFAEMVEPISKKHSVKQDCEKKEKPRYFLADQKIQIGDFNFKNSDLFILIGTDLIFERDKKRFTIKNINSAVFQYLTEI